MTITEFKEHRLFRLLTDQEKQWILKWIENGGDGIAATKEIFNVTSEASARALTAKINRRPQIEAVINVWMGEADEIEELAGVMREIIINPKASATSRVAAGRLLAELRGAIKSGKSSRSEDKEDLDELFKDID